MRWLLGRVNVVPRVRVGRDGGFGEEGLPTRAHGLKPQLGHSLHLDINWHHSGCLERLVSGCRGHRGWLHEGAILRVRKIHCARC